MVRSCAVLSFLATVCHLDAQHMQLPMPFMLLLLGPPPCLHTATGGAHEPMASLAAVGGCAFCSSLGLVTLLGTPGSSPNLPCARQTH